MDHYFSCVKQKELGFNLKLPSFISNNNTFHGQKCFESEDEDWVSEAEKKRKPVKRRLKPSKRKSSTILKPTFQPDYNNSDEEQEADATLRSSQTSVQHLFHAVTLASDVGNKIKIDHYFPSESISEKNSPRIEGVDTSQQKRYPKRSCQRKNCNETVTVKKDDYIFCDQCNGEYIGGCPFHPLILLLNNNVSRDGSEKNHGETTAPWPMCISQSKIKEAGLGVWTTAHIPRGLVFGPFEGRIYLNVKPGEESGFGWKIKNEIYPGKYIDAVDASISNWLRFINCSRSFAETNLKAFQYKGEIYYKTITDIRRGEELMVWYGDDYGRELGYKREDCPAHKRSGIMEDFIIDRRDGINKDKGLKPSQPLSPKYYENRSLFTKCKETSDDTLPLIYKDAAYSMVDNNNNNNNNNKIVSLEKGFANDCDTCKQNCVPKLDVVKETDNSCKVQNVSPILIGEILKVEKPNINIVKEINSENTNIDESREPNTSCNKKLGKFPLKNHPRNRKNELPFECQYCHKRFDYKSRLVPHIRIHTGERPYGCEYCRKTFNLSSNLNKHLLTHTGERPFACEKCGKRFNQDNHLKQHLRIHTGDKPFRCEICDKTFTNACHLKIHLRIHTGETPHACKYCNKKFKQLISLKIHTRIHTGEEKPFGCKFCSKTFDQSSNLKRHLQIHSCKKGFDCGKCGKKFKDTSDLNKHLRVRLKEQKHSGKKIKLTFFKTGNI